eukprot:5647-Chlamydomonas_euryale.AAC.4
MSCVSSEESLPVRQVDHSCLSCVSLSLPWLAIRRSTLKERLFIGRTHMPRAAGVYMCHEQRPNTMHGSAKMQPERTRAKDVARAAATRLRRYSL